MSGRNDYGSLQISHEAACMTSRATTLFRANLSKETLLLACTNSVSLRVSVLVGRHVIGLQEIVLCGIGLRPFVPRSVPLWRGEIRGEFGIIRSHEKAV